MRTPKRIGVVFVLVGVGLIAGCARTDKAMTQMKSDYKGEVAPVLDPLVQVKLVKLASSIESGTTNQAERILGEIDSTCREKELESRLTQFARRIGAEKVEYEVLADSNSGGCDVDGSETALRRRYGILVGYKAWFLTHKPKRPGTCEVYGFVVI